LVYFADFLRIQGRFSEASDFLERCLYAFENAFSFDFCFVPRGERSASSIQLDLGPNSEPLNKTLCECLLKYIDILGRQGCNRTAVEYCKLLLALAPNTDPYGVLLRFDYYALRAKEYQMLIKFVSDFCNEIHLGKGSLCLLPNYFMTLALAKRGLSGEITQLDQAKE
jgi:hypothetical protein